MSYTCSIIDYLNFMEGQSTPPCTLRPQDAPIRHPLQQPNTYGNLSDFLMNLIMSITVAQSISVGCKLGFLSSTIQHYRSYSAWSRKTWTVSVLLEQAR